MAYFTNYGCQVNLGDTTHARWQVPTSLHIMFASIIFLLSFLQYESPRYLIKQGRQEEALTTMSRLRKLPETHPYVTSEIAAINRAAQEELEATKTGGFFGKLREIFLIPSNLYRLYLAVGAQIMSQCSCPFQLDPPSNMC